MTGVALIIGGSSAIGTAVARTLLELGADVVLWGRDRSRLEAATSRLAAGDRVSHTCVDVRDRTALTAAVAGLGGTGLSTVVWAAGVFDWDDADTADPDAWDEVLDTNLVAAARLTRLVLPTLLANAPAALVYLGSGAARQAYPHNAAYVASKHGLRGLAEGVWLDVRDRGVKVSVVSPGLVAAGAGLRSPAAARDPGRLLQPDDVAAAVRFVVTFPHRGCPVEIRLEPQRTPS